MSQFRIAVDTGGTFTDCLMVNNETNEVTWAKVPSTPDSPDRAIVEGVRQLEVDADAIAFFGHGTTVAINTLVQRVGARTGLITTRGFRDNLEIQRFNRPDMYNLFYKKPEPLVPRNLRYEVTERVLADGSILTPLDMDELEAAVAALVEKGVNAIAVAFLHSYLRADHEEAAVRHIRERYPHVVAAPSHEVAREWREYERTSTTVMNAYLGPSVKDYLNRLNQGMADQGYEGAVLVTKSDGGLSMARTAADRSIDLLMSGPAGGVLGACDFARVTGMRNLITFDIGGTTCDVSLIADAQPTRVRDKDVERYPVLAPFIDVYSIGAGGGTVIWLDGSGMLRVGPHSAGSSPGPACYNRGGEQPTVTDAYVILGLIDPNAFLGGKMPLRRDLAEAAFRKIAEPLGMTVEECALGALTILDHNMVDAIRVVSVQRGHDPRDFALMGFGGAGALHIGSLASKLNIPAGLVPMYPSHLSAWGILAADIRHSYVRTYNQFLDQVDLPTLNSLLAEMIALGKAELERDQIAPEHMQFVATVDMRYQGQEHAVNIICPAELSEADLTALAERFHEAHEVQYTYAMREQRCGIITVRVDAIGRTPRPMLSEIEPNADVAAALKGTRKVMFDAKEGMIDCPIYDRLKFGAGARVEGPAIIEEPTSTTVVLRGQSLKVDAYGNLILKTM